MSQSRNSGRNKPKARPPGERARSHAAPAFTKSSPQRGPSATATKANGELIYGLRASIACLEQRPQDILRLHRLDVLHPDLRAALNKLPAQVEQVPVQERALRAMTESDQHEGVCLETKPRRFLGIADFAQGLLQKKGVVLALSQVRNPYNVGSILRSAAFFGAHGVLFGDTQLTSHAVRVAEGGAEHLVLSRTTDLAASIVRLKEQQIRVYGAEAGGQLDAMSTRFASLRPLVLVVGNEREGIDSRVRNVCDGFVSIRGTGAIESLNVSIASSVLLSQLCRASH